MSKKEISQDVFIDMLLEIRHEVEIQIIDLFREKFQDTGDEKKFIFEIRIFSLWILTISLPKMSNELLDTLHNRICEQLGMSDHYKKLYLKEISNRYENYYIAFNMWNNNPQNGHMIGTAMIEIINNQNSKFVSNKTFPLIGADDALIAFIIFGESFKVTMNMIREVKKKYIIK